MKQIVIAASAAILMANPALSEDSGTSLMEKGAQLFFEGIMQEFKPAIEDLKGLAETVQPQMRSFLEEMGPHLGELLERIEDFSAYHPPEILPNGDIIMRKKSEREMEEADKEIEI